MLVRPTAEADMAPTRVHDIHQHASWPSRWPTLRTERTEWALRGDPVPGIGAVSRIPAYRIKAGHALYCTPPSRQQGWSKLSLALNPRLIDHHGRVSAHTCRLARIGQLLRREVRPSLDKNMVPHRQQRPMGGTAVVPNPVYLWRPRPRRHLHLGKHFSPGRRRGGQWQAGKGGPRNVRGCVDHDAKMGALVGMQLREDFQIRVALIVALVAQEFLLISAPEPPRRTRYSGQRARQVAVLAKLSRAQPCPKASGRCPPKDIVDCFDR